LGYKNAPFHEEWYRYLQNQFSPLKTHPDLDKKFLLLWPRGCAKSESTSINYVSWLIGNNPDIHVDIVTKTATLAEDILTALMTRFETDDAYIGIFGELKPKPARKWTSSEIIVKRSEISKNPTLKATGLMGAITGGRSDLIICDDLIDEENVRTTGQIDKTLTWFQKVLYPTLYPWGGVIVIGTRWHYADLYSYLLPMWKHDVKSAIIKEEGKPDQALWPEYWSLDKLKERQEAIGSIYFNCQYMNDPTGMEGDLLRSEWLHSYDNLPSNLTWFAGVDPALGEGDKASIAVFGYDKTLKQGYLTDVWAKRESFPEFIQQLERMHMVHRFSKIYLESNAFQKVLGFVPELRRMPTVPSRTFHDKASRFIAMSSHFEAKRILVNPQLNQPDSEFWTEWVQFPRGQCDDALDGVEIVVREVLETGSWSPGIAYLEW